MEWKLGQDVMYERRMKKRDYLYKMQKKTCSKLTVLYNKKGDAKSRKYIPFQLFNNSTIVYVLGAIGFPWP